jgi:hypothetical protein
MTEKEIIRRAVFLNLSITTCVLLQNLPKDLAQIMSRQIELAWQNKALKEELYNFTSLWDAGYQGRII